MMRGVVSPLFSCLPSRTVALLFFSAAITCSMAGDTALRIQDIGGKWHEPLADNKTTAVVLVFVLVVKEEVQMVMKMLLQQL